MLSTASIFRVEHAKYYVIAMLQLLFAGIGLHYSLYAAWPLKWNSSPEGAKGGSTTRNSGSHWSTSSISAIRGECGTDEKDPFETMFECYRASLVVPRVRLGGIELVVNLVESILSAIIWKENPVLATIHMS